MTKKVVVIGESGRSNDRYDAQAVRHLILAHQPDWQVTALKKPAVMVRGRAAARAKAATRVADLYRQLSQDQAVDAVFNQADTDEVEPSHEAAASAIEAALSSAGCPGYAAVCAWEIEAWFFLWPEAIEAVNAAWKVPKSRRGRDVGQFTSPKEILKTEVLKRGSRPQLAYQEKHAPLIAEAAAADIDAVEGSSRSYKHFVGRIVACASA